jgi:hypothetical protein
MALLGGRSAVANIRLRGAVPVAGCQLGDDQAVGINDERLAGLMLALLRRGVNETWHVRFSKIQQNGRYHFALRKTPHDRTPDR